MFAWTSRLTFREVAGKAAKTDAISGISLKLYCRDETRVELSNDWAQRNPRLSFSCPVPHINSVVALKFPGPEFSLLLSKEPSMPVKLSYPYALQCQFKSDSNPVGLSCSAKDGWNIQFSTFKPLGPFHVFASGAQPYAIGCNVGCLTVKTQFTPKHFEAFEAFCRAPPMSLPSFPVSMAVTSGFSIGQAKSFSTFYRIDAKHSLISASFADIFDSQCGHDLRAEISWALGRAKFRTSHLSSGAHLYEFSLADSKARFAIWQDRKASSLTVTFPDSISQGADLCLSVSTSGGCGLAIGVSEPPVSRQRD